MRKGFSLVELSIVLVILGLLTGGILAGQSLIHAAELRSITTDYNKYLAATRAFRDKYFAVPGDMTNATAFWGSLGGTGSDATCQAIAATGTATCNGDGDGSVYNAISTVERFRFWQHLANAGLIEGNFTGVAGSGYVPGSNVPLSKISNNYFSAAPSPAYTGAGSTTYYAGNTIIFAGDYGKNYFGYSSANGTTTTAGSLALSPADAWNIDTKLDDGVPGTGSLIVFKGDGTNTFCTSAAGVAPPTDAGATYKLTNSNKDCLLYFVRAF